MLGCEGARGRPASKQLGQQRGAGRRGGPGSDTGCPLGKGSVRSGPSRSPSLRSPPDARCCCSRWSSMRQSPSPKCWRILASLPLCRGSGYRCRERSAWQGDGGCGCKSGRARDQDLGFGVGGLPAPPPGI